MSRSDVHEALNSFALLRLATSWREKKHIKYFNGLCIYLFYYAYAFMALITSSAAAAELGQHNSQLTVSCANLYSSFQKKISITACTKQVLWQFKRCVSSVCVGVCFAEERVLISRERH